MEDLIVISPKPVDTWTRPLVATARHLAGGLLLTGLATAPAALLADVTYSTTEVTRVKRIASGLANPRGIAFSASGKLFVAENGQGGPGPCILSPVQPPPPAPPAFRCYGETGALSRINPDGTFRRAITGLPSMALANGTTEGGPAKLSFHGDVGYLTMGLGGDPTAVRAALGGGNADLFGKQLRFTMAGRYQIALAADVAAHEATLNPAGGAIDSNPYGLVAQPGRTIVADAGANALIEVQANGSTRTFALPAPLTTPFPREPVPTSVAVGPDGALYVGLLTGFPFFQGSASVLRYESDGSGVSTYASGFTAIVDLAFDNGGALYVLETATGQVPPFPPPNPGLGNGRLKRQCPGGSPTVLVDGLTFPGGLTIGPDDAAYVTNFGTSPSAGEVLRVGLKPCPR
jgi:sugar lactone lactonase YvrE